MNNIETSPVDPRKRTRRQRIVIAILLALGVLGAAAILRMEAPKPADEHGHADEHAHKDEHGHDHGDSHAEAAPKGPHGGQLMTEGAFGLEVRVVEDGESPRMKVWLFNKDQPLPPSAATVSVTLTRPDGRQQEITFAFDKDGLKSVQPIEEPHVFEATIAAQTPTEPYLFDYRMQEGRINLSDAQVKAAGITVDTTGPSTLRSTLQWPGEIRFNEDRTARLVPRVAGVVDNVPVTLGEVVRKGQVLAVLSSAAVSDHRSELQVAQRRFALARTTYEREKRLWEEKISPEQDVLQAQQAMREAEISIGNAQQKLQALGAAATTGASNRYELRAPFDGMVVERRIGMGEAVKEDAPAFTLSDLSTVWATVSVPARELNQLRVGEQVIVRSASNDEPVRGRVSYVSPSMGEQTRAAEVRVVVPNPQLAWRPGLPIVVEPLAAEALAPVTVAADAIQNIDGKPTLFLQVPGGFLPQPVQIGRSDGKRVEIVKGVAPGATYAAGGSFVLKSEHGKANAGHGH